MICGLSSDGRLHIFFDWPLAWQLGNGVRWWTNGPGHFWQGKDYIEALLIIIYDRKAEMPQVRLYMASQD